MFTEMDVVLRSLTAQEVGIYFGKIVTFLDALHIVFEFMIYIVQGYFVAGKIICKQNLHCHWLSHVLSCTMLAVDILHNLEKKFAIIDSLGKFEVKIS